MKLPRETAGSMYCREIQIILPKLPQKKPQPNGSFKRKKSKPVRNSGCSDKENNSSKDSILSTQSNLSLIQKKKIPNKDLRNRFSKRPKLSEDDHEFLLTALNNKRKSTKDSKVDSVKMKSTAVRSSGVVSRSQSITVSRVTTGVAGSSDSHNGVETNRKSSNAKHQNNKMKKDKCFRKDSGIEVESPKKNQPVKRKFSDLSDGTLDDLPDQEKMESVVPITDSTNKIRDFLKPHSSHKCTDKIDRKMGCVETLQTPNGMFVQRDFVIRIQQCCINLPFRDYTPECTTSVVASATQCVNIEGSVEKVCENISLNKIIGISTSVKVGDEEKTCSRIVQSKFVQTVKQNHKKIKMNEPSTMVTRRKAAFSSQYEFFRLTHDKKLGLLVDSNVPKIQSGRTTQNKKNDTDGKKKLNCFKKKVTKEKGEKNLNSFKKKVSIGIKSTKIRSRNDEEEPMSTSSQFNEAMTEISKKSDASIINLQTMTFSKILDSVTLCREESLGPSTSQVIHKPTTSTSENDSKVGKTNSKKTDIDQQENSSFDEPRLRKSSRVRKPRVKLSYGSDMYDNDDTSSTYEPSPALVKRSKNRSHSKNVDVSAQSVKPSDLKSFVKLKVSISGKKKQNDEVEVPKKTDSSMKKLMKKTEALKKTERYHLQKKSLKNSNKTTQLKTVLSKDSALPRFFSKSQNNGFVTNNDETEVNEETSYVSTSSKTPNTISRSKNGKKVDDWKVCSPYILLDKLDVKDISTYAITPLREDRRPQPSKSYEDYGIDDVNTDDSTDEEDYPKKVVPQWVKSKDHATNVQFYFPREVITKWIRPPTTRFTVKSLFF